MNATSSYRTQSALRTSTATVALLLLCLFSIFPIYWMFKASFEDTSALLHPSLIPWNPSLDNYQELFATRDFAAFAINSALAAAGTVALTVIAATIAGYGLARFPVRGGKFVARGVLFSYMFPALAVAIPMYILFRAFHLTNSMPGLVLAHTSMALPFGIWLMWQFFQSIPTSFQESAYTLGAGRLRTFLQVELPLAMPGVVTVAIFAFAASWEDYTFAFILETATPSWTLPVAVNSFVHGDYVSWGLVTTVGVFMVLPPLIIVLALQKYLVTGVGAGGLKG